MKSRPLFDTAQGKDQLRAMHVLSQKLTIHTDPLTVAATWRDLRQERYIEPGLEGLTGEAATYHLNDAAGYVVSAARILAGKWELPLRPTDVPRHAIHMTAKGYGYRYERGVKGLHDALKAAAVPHKWLDEFDDKRAEFRTRFNVHVTAAFIVNERGESPAAAATVTRMFVDEIASLGFWLEHAGKCGEAALLTPQMNKARDMLAGCSPQLEHKKRRKTHRRQHATD